MTRVKETDSVGPSPADVSAIDDLLKEGAPPVAVYASPEKAGANLPRKVDIDALLRAMGDNLRGVPGTDFSVPAYYSERETRLTFARIVARTAVETVGQLCLKEDGLHHCPSEAVCDLVERAKVEPIVLDHLAAAVLMPTTDISKWGKILEWKDGMIADNYAVPIELAHLRRLDLQALGNSA